MGICHHIDFDNLQIVVNNRRGQEQSTYRCMLCDKEFNEKEYKEMIKELRKKSKDKRLDEWRTPNGDLQKVEEDE